MGQTLRRGLRSAGSTTLLLLAVGVVLWWPQSLGGKVAYVRVDGHSMTPTLRNGDLAVVRRQSSYRVGDAVAYRIPQGEFGAGALVVHRLVGGDGVHGFVTRGDNKSLRDEWHPRTGDIVGRIRYDIPHGGAAMAWLSRPVYLGGLVSVLTVLVMIIPPPRRGRHARPARPTLLRSG